MNDYKGSIVTVLPKRENDPQEPVLLVPTVSGLYNFSKPCATMVLLGYTFNIAIVIMALLSSYFTTSQPCALFFLELSQIELTMYRSNIMLDVTFKLIG